MNIIEMAVLKKLFGGGGGSGGGAEFKSTATLMAAETKCEEKVD